MIYPYLMLRGLHKVGWKSKQLSEANLPVVDWDGTPSEYLTPHPTPESGSNILIPLPSRWSGGYCLCILLITGYRFQTYNVCAF